MHELVCVINRNISLFFIYLFFKAAYISNIYIFFKSANKIQSISSWQWALRLGSLGGSKTLLWCKLFRRLRISIWLWQREDVRRPVAMTTERGQGSDCGARGGIESARGFQKWPVCLLKRAWYAILDIADNESAPELSGRWVFIH